MSRSPSWFARFMLAALTLPTLKSALGIDGGALFQIFALENLGASPAAIGTALGLGVVSVPVQLWAARMSISSAPRNLGAFFGALALGGGLLAMLPLVAGDRGDADVIAVVGLGVTVVAELAVSVLFATSWQPLLFANLDSRQRQVVSSRGRAAGSVVLVLVLLAFGAGGTALRVCILAGVSAVACVMVLLLRRAPVTARHETPEVALPARASAGEGAPTVPRHLWPLLVLTGFAAASAWPLFPAYAKVTWPSVALGVIGAVEIGASVAVATLWRPTTGDLLPRARLAAAALVLMAVVFVATPAPGGSGGLVVVVVVAYGLAVAARDVILLAGLELVHRGVSSRSSVRTMTFLDVIESTSLQLMLFTAGLLITWTAAVDLGPADAYRVSVLIIDLGVVVSLRAVSRSQDQT